MSLTLTNYWWLLIWLFVGGAICNYFPKRREVLGDRVVTRWDIWPAIIMVLPYIIWAGFRGNIGDTWLYKQQFIQASSNVTDIPALFLGDVKDPGYTAVVILFKATFGNQTDIFFLAISVFQILALALVFRKYSSNYWISIFLFIASTDYLSWTWNGMRQFIAVILIFSCFEWLVKKKYVKLMLAILLASLIHGSAVLMIPIVFIVQGKAWNTKTILMLVATVLIVLLVDSFTPIFNNLLQDTQYDDIMTNELWVVDDGTNVIRVLIYSIPALLSFFGLRFVRSKNDPIINICVNCSIVTMALYCVSAVTSGIYVGRLPIYTTLYDYIALPWLIDQMFTRESARLVKIIMVTFFVLFFYYQVFISWGW